MPPPRVASTQDPQVSEKLDGPDGATGSALDSDEWSPAETAIATISVDGRVHVITVSPDGEHVYVARSDSVMVLNGRHHIVGKIPVSGSAKSLVMDADGKQLFVVCRSSTRSRTLSRRSSTSPAIPKQWRSVPTGSVSMWATIGPVPSR